MSGQGTATRGPTGPPPAGPQDGRGHRARAAGWHGRGYGDPRAAGPDRRAGGPAPAGAGRPRQPAQAVRHPGQPGRGGDQGRGGRGMAAGRRQPRARAGSLRGRSGRHHRGGPGGRDQAVGVLARLGFPRRDDLGAMFDPARHEAVASRPDPARRRAARWSRSSGPATATETTSCGPRRWWWPGRTDGGRPRLLRDPGRADGPPARTRSSGPTASWPGPITRTSTRSGGRGAVQGHLRGLRRPVRSADPAPLRRLRPRLPPGSRGRGPGDLAARPGRAGAGRPGRSGAGWAPGGGAGRARSGTGGFSFGDGDIDFEDLLGGLFGGRAGRGWGPIRGRRPGGRARADRRGGLPGHPQDRSPCRGDGPADPRRRRSRPG